MSFFFLSTSIWNTFCLIFVIEFVFCFNISLLSLCFESGNVLSLFKVFVSLSLRKMWGLQFFHAFIFVILSKICKPLCIGSFYSKIETVTIDSTRKDDRIFSWHDIMKYIWHTSYFTRDVIWVESLDFHIINVSLLQVIFLKK